MPNSVFDVEQIGAAPKLAEWVGQAKVHLAKPSAEASRFFKEFAETLKAFRGLEDAALRVEGSIDAAQYFYLSGQHMLSISTAQDAVALAEATDIQPLLWKALNCHGIMCADTGNLPLAIEAHGRALEIARELLDHDSECKTWNNLGLAFLYAAQYREAVGCFERVIQLSEDEPWLASYRVAALTNNALACLHLEDYRAGLRSIEQAVRESAEAKTVGEFLSATIRENNYTRLLLEVDNLKLAKERCEIAKRNAAQSKIARAEIIASIAEGLYEVHAGLIDVGLSRLTSTLEKARMIRSALRDTLIAMVKAYEIAGAPERALVYLRELLEHTRKHQQENALTHLRLHGARQRTNVDADAIRPTSSLERHEALLKGKLAEQELFRSRLEMLERLAVAAELRDDSTGEHSYRVGKLSALLAAEYGCDDDTIFMLDLAGRLHDIGKIGVPDAILLKPGRLNHAEIQIMRAHTTVGAELLAKSNIAHMQMAEEIARYHHEWWDGSGYPSHLSGTAIPISARITALADVFDALTHRRPYKEAWPIDDALAEIASLRGRQFDPQLTDYFLALLPRLQSEHGDLDGFLGQAARKSPFLQARSKIWASLRGSDRLSG